MKIGNIKIRSKLLLVTGLMGLMVSFITLIPATSFGNEPNLIGIWQFEEGTGTIASDASGKGNNGTIVEPVWINGKIGNALQFNGNSYVEIPYNAVLSPRNAITLEAWINPANNMQWRKIISKSLGGNTDYSFFQGDKNNIAFSIKMGSIARTVYAPANTLPLGEWTYVVGTYDGTRMRLYLNGIQVNSIAISGQINCHAEPLRIGGEAGAYFKGQIDEVSVYNAALSAAAILGRYEAANNVPAPVVEEAVITPDGKRILIAFDKDMATPPAAPAGFAVTVNGEQRAIKDVSLDSNKLVIGLTMCNPILAVDTDVLVAYSGGNVKAADGGILANFSNLSVLNRSTAPLLGRWQFDEGEGTIATDASGNGNNGIINGSVWANGRVGKALLFAANGYVEIAHQDALSPRNAITLEAWINPANNMQWRKIISKSLGGNTDYSFFQGDKNNIAFSIKMGSIARTVYAPANTLPLGEWTHVVGTYDGCRMRMYINGVQVNSIAISGEINYHAEPLRIGGEAGAYFKGQIDEVSVYNAALSATQILKRYEAANQALAPAVIEAVTTNDGQQVLITFDQEMAVLPAAPAGFTVTVDGVDNPVQAVELNTDNNAIIRLILANTINSNVAEILVSYTAGTVVAKNGGALVNFVDQTVVNQSTVTPPLQVQQYTYDGLNRLTEVLLPGGQTIQYRYDLGGNLISVKVVE